MPAGHPLSVGATDIFCLRRAGRSTHIETPLTDEQTRWLLERMGGYPTHLENRIMAIPEAFLSRFRLLFSLMCQNNPTY